MRGASVGTDGSGGSGGNAGTTGTAGTGGTAGPGGTAALSYTLDPADGTQLDARSPITVTFNKEMEPTTLALGGGLGGASFSTHWSAHGPTPSAFLEIRPVSHWPYATTHDIHIDVEAADGEVASISATFDGWSQLAFVTQAEGTGDLSSWADADGNTGVAAGDAICNAEAAAAGLPGTYVAYLSDDTTDAFCHVSGRTGKRAAGCDGTPEQVHGPYQNAVGFPVGTMDQIHDGFVYWPVDRPFQRPK